MFLLYEYRLKIACRAQPHESIDPSFCWGRKKKIVGFMASPLSGAQPRRSPGIQGGRPFERTTLHGFHVPLRQPHPHRCLAGRQTEQEPTGEDGSVTFWQGLKETL